MQNVRTLVQKNKDIPDSVEIIGGGSRIPKFQQIVSTVLDWPIKKTVNSSEAIAKGSSLLLKKLENRTRLAKLRIKQRMAQGVVMFVNCYSR
jgi:molecular chaperone DnaK (HSP70)